MSTYYFDASALVKIYIHESGSQWVEKIFLSTARPKKPRHQIALSKIGIVEVAAAISRQERLGGIGADIKRDLYGKFIADCHGRYRLINLTDDIIQLAADLTQRQNLRGYDAVHLASAIWINREFQSMKLANLVFTAADDLLCRVAKDEGLTTENPNFYE
jgi:uncharacterized protein